MWQQLAARLSAWASLPRGTQGSQSVFSFGDLFLTCEDQRPTSTPPQARPPSLDRWQVAVPLVSSCDLDCGYYGLCLSPKVPSLQFVKMSREVIKGAEMTGKVPPTAGRP